MTESAMTFLLTLASGILAACVIVGSVALVDRLIERRERIKRARSRAHY